MHAALVAGVAVLALSAAAPASASSWSRLRPGRVPARTSCTRRRRARRSSRTPACGGRRRSSSRARAPTATASSSTRTSSTTTTARAASATPATRACARPRSRPRPTAPTRTRPIPCTPGTRPTSSSCASSRCAGRPRSGVTLNTLIDPARVAFTIAIGGRPGRTASAAARRGASAPADLFLTVHGDRPSWSTPPRAPRRATPHVQGRPAPPPVHRVGGPRRLGPGPRHGAPGGGRRAVGRRRRTATCSRARRPRPTRRAARAASRPRPRSSTWRSAFSEPFQGPDFSIFTNPGWWRDRLQGLFLKDRATSGQFARRSTSPSSPRASTTTCRGSPPACRRRARSTASSRAASRPQQGIDYSTVCLSGEAGGAARCRTRARESCAAGCSRTRLRPAQAACRPPATGSRCCCTPSAATTTSSRPRATSRSSASAARARSSSRPRARARRLLPRPRRGGRVRGVGRRRAPLPGSIPTGRRSPATRWAATAPTSSRSQFPDLFARVAHDRRPAGHRVDATRARCSSRCATSRS